MKPRMGRYRTVTCLKTGQLLRQLQFAAPQIKTIAGIAGGGKNVGVQAIDDEPPLLFGLDDLLALQNLQVVRDIRDVLLQLRGNIADVLRPAAQHLDDSKAVFVGQGFQPLGALL